MKFKRLYFIVFLLVLFFLINNCYCSDHDPFADEVILFDQPEGSSHDDGDVSNALGPKDDLFVHSGDHISNENQPVFFQENEHYYEAVHVNDGITWDEAREIADKKMFEGLSGHLATITSQTENDFVYNSLGGELLAGYWLGAYQPNGSNEPNGNWQWVTGENWNYSNWGGTEPNNSYGGEFGGAPAGSDEEALQLHPTSSPPYTWNDMEKTALMTGFIIEYENINDHCDIVDSDSDGVIDQWDDCSNTPNDAIITKNGCPVHGLYTEEQMNEMINSILSWGDLNGDNKINLIEAIKALRITSGVTVPSVK